MKNQKPHFKDILQIKLYKLHKNPVEFCTNIGIVIFA